MRVAALAAVALAWPFATSAQTISGGAVKQVYTLAEPTEIRLQSIELLALPFAGQVSVRSSAALSVTGAYAEGAMQLATGERSRTAGLSDTRVALDAVFGNVRTTLSALLPTGEVVQTEADALMVGLLSTDLLPFAVSQWGTGGGYGADLGYRLGLGPVALELSGGGTMMLESTPIEEGQLSYQPGKQIRVRGTAEAPVGDAGIVTVAFGIQRFTTDTYDGRNLFRPGSRSDLAASYAFAIGSRESAVVFGSLTRMTAGVSDVRAHHLDYQGFTPAVSDRPGRTITRGGGELRLARGRFTVTPGAEIRVLRRTDGVGQGWIGSFGGRGELTLVGGGFRRRIIAEPGVWFRTGHIVASDAVESGVSGWEASLTLRWEGGR